jgi:hypothetical protein
VSGVICKRFHLDATQVRWFGSEPNGRLNLKPLDGLRAAKDIVYCITGHVGHPERDATKQRCVKRGIQLRHVEYANQIADDLRAQFG